MVWRFLIQTHDDEQKNTEENRRQPAPRTREPADACLSRSRRVLRTAAARSLNQSSVPSIFLTTCIFSAAHTSAVTEIHSTSRSLSRFFLFTVLTPVLCLQADSGKNSDSNLRRSARPEQATIRTVLCRRPSSCYKSLLPIPPAVLYFPAAGRTCQTSAWPGCRFSRSCLL